MKKKLSERNVVILLFAIVLIAFAFATEDGKRLDRLYSAPADSSALPDTSQHISPE